MTHSAKLHVGKKMPKSCIQSNVDIYGKSFHIYIFLFWINHSSLLHEILGTF